LSASGSLACPVVEPSGMIVPRGGTGTIDAQLAATSVVTVGCGGVVTDGGAWAAAPCATIVSSPKRSAGFLIWRKQMPRAAVPFFLRLAVADH
jgi:hypothetical protein